jgi:hypothetical protein
MTTEKSPLEKWLFVAALSLLGIVAIWQLLKDQQIAPPPPVPPLNVVETEPFTVNIIAGGRYTLEDLTYFQEIAFGSEHQYLEPKIRKWAANIQIRVEGDPTAEDLITLKTIIDEINTLQNSIELSIDYFESNMIISFQPEKTFKDSYERYRPFNPGYFWVRWINEEIYHANILIDSDSITQATRNAIIQEEITQSLGLMNTSSRFPDSLFNDDKLTTGHGLSDMDRKLVGMLYQPDIKPGMSVEEALTVLSQTTTPQVDAPEPASVKAEESQ